MESRYKIWQAIYMSFYSKALYRDVAQNWKGKPFLYLLFLLAVTWIIFVAQIQHNLNVWYKKNADQIASQVPIITIKNGLISTPENRPYIITEPESQETLAVIDTSGKYTSTDEANVPVLITKNAIITHPKPSEMRVDTLPTSLNTTIVPHTVNHYIKDYFAYIWVFLFFFCLITSYIYRLIQALIYSIIGKIYCAILQVPLHYGQVLSISLVAVTPAIIIATVLDFMMINIVNLPLIYFVISMLYLFFAVHANKNNPA